MSEKPSDSTDGKYWLVALGIGLIFTLPFWFWGVPGGNDLLHHFRLANGFYDSLLVDDIYPSWLATTNGGLGDPSVRFYPPGLYILFALFRWLLGDWYLSANIVFSILTIVGSIGAYFYAQTVAERRYYAIIAAILWTVAPFHANELYQAGMYGQYAAACIFPFLFAFVERLFQKSSRLDVLFLAVSYALVILFHLPTAIFVTIAVAIYIVVKCVQNLNLKACLSVVSGCAFGAAISCFYWVPAVLEIKWKFPSGVGQGEWFDYRNNFLFSTSPSFMANYWLPYLFWVTTLLLVPAIVGLFKGWSKTLPAIFLTGLTFLLATQLSKPLWDALPVLQETQFPWRWLTLTSFFLIIISVVSFEQLESAWRTKKRPLMLLAIGATAIVVTFSLSQIIRAGLYHERQEFNELAATLRDSPTNPDFLPVWANPRAFQENGGLSHEKNVYSERPVQVHIWEPEHKEFIIADGPSNDVSLSLLYYPLWIATASNGDRLATRPDADGKMVIHVPSDADTIKVDFVEPSTTFAANVVSFTAAALSLFLVILWTIRPNGTPALRPSL